MRAPRRIPRERRVLYGVGGRFVALALRADPSACGIVVVESPSAAALEAFRVNRALDLSGLRVHVGAGRDPAERERARELIDRLGAAGAQTTLEIADTDPDPNLRAARLVAILR